MIRMIDWLSRHKALNILLAAAFFLAVVSFHDEVTDLALYFRRKVNLSGYNLFFTIGTALSATIWIYWAFRHARRRFQPDLILLFLIPTLLLTLVFFLFMLTYTIEAIHFIQYAILALLLFPLLKSYGATVFWTTILGMFDEIYQYVVLTPFFKYFDFNDILLNLAGAGIAAVSIRLAGSLNVPKDIHTRALLSSAVFILIVVAAFSLAYCAGFIRWYSLPGEVHPGWFSINRAMPQPGFWTEVYQGRFIHIAGHFEGLFAMALLFAYYFSMDRLPFDHFLPKYRKA